MLIINACIRAGAFWTLENPKSSLMFLMPKVRKLIQRSDVYSVTVDQCSFGLRDPESGHHYKKPTRIIGNLPSLSRLEVRCDGTHEHTQVIGKVCVNGKWTSRSVLAGTYPVGMCNALAKIVCHDLHAAGAQRRSRRRDTVL